MNRNVGFVLLAALLVFLVYFFFFREGGESEDTVLLSSPKRQPFQIVVTATGELKAKNSIQIRAPQAMRSVGIYNTTISDIIPEGTVVKQGDYVATLDRTEIANKMKEVQTEIDKVNTQLEQARIDTAIELRGLRDQITNTGFALEEKQLQVKQSKFEPQMIIRQAELDYEKTKRDLDQLIVKYQLKIEQSKAKISEITASLRQAQNKLQRYQELSEQFIITAPEAGMVIYERGWQGKKGPGSQVSAWNNTVAELPDLTDMISKTYVNEVDISKVKKGQEVDIKVDAFPNKSFAGKVISVANIGQELPNRETRVFEVVVQLQDLDSTLRPAMTTSNAILVYQRDSALSIPIEAIYNDSLDFVLVEEGGRMIRKEVIVGFANTDRIQIYHGLQPDDQVVLTYIDEVETLPWQPLSPAIKQKMRDKWQKEKEEWQIRSKAAEKSVTEDYNSQDEGGESFIIIQ